VSGMGGYTSKCEKSKNHCTLMYSIDKVRTRKKEIEGQGFR
jgi:hypothetical protein